MKTPTSDRGLAEIEKWFVQRDWAPFEFQRQVWRSYLAGDSGLIHSATGTGKTLAAWLGPVAEAVQNDDPGGGLRVIWITPLRALAFDTVLSLRDPIQDLLPSWRVEARTGDTTSGERARQKVRMPECLVTTPESLTLMLTHENLAELISGLNAVIVDEWHELMSTKRGVQTELALAHLRTICPDIRTWGVSATLGNLPEAQDTLLGVGGKGCLVEGEIPKQVLIDSIIPEEITRFPWSGHFGKQMIGPVIEAIAEGGTCLVFCNTRSQSEIWFNTIRNERPEWGETIALHHGSLSREERDLVESRLKAGDLRAVICTSSLDLGVDFTPVDRVLQVGSPKGVARLLQRAGRSGHQPGGVSKVTCVPTHAFELIDIAGARGAAVAGRIESREGVKRPLDVLAQHLVTMAIGGGFREEELKAEIKTTAAYYDLADDEWTWTLRFVTEGGEALRAYPEFKRVVEKDGRYIVEDRHIAQRHRMSIGTITSDTSLTVQYLRGHKLGTVEESFISRLRPRDKFHFAGKTLEFIRIKDMTALVKPATNISGAIPRWMGGRLPLSGQLALSIREKLEDAKYGVLEDPEMLALQPILELQARWSALPAVDEFLIERVQSREGHHLFFYPVEGRLVHEGLAALFAFRISRLRPITFSLAMNDYGFELLSTFEPPIEEALAGGLLSPLNLAEDIPASLNSVEMARRQFREIARVAGLIFQGFPGMPKSSRQIQASSGLFYDVFSKYEPSNRLLHQAAREVLERQLEQSRMGQALERLQGSKILITDPPKPTPMSFPILVDRLRESVSTESISDRIERLSVMLEKEASKKPSKP